MRNIKFQTGEYYHIYNRGVDKRDIFECDKDFVRFLVNLRLFNNNSTKVERDFIVRKNAANPELGSGYPEPSSKLVVDPKLFSFVEKLPKLVEITSYCLNHNHYHFLIKQSADDGISKFMHKLDLGYTHYFNKKYNRSGALFQGKFRAVHVKEYGHLLKLLVYVNCNYEVHNFGKAKNWIWSSYLDSIDKRSGTLCNFNTIKENFKTVEEFKEFCDEVIPETKKNKKLQKYLLE